MISDLEEFHILKKLAAIKDLDYPYEIDEDGYGIAEIDGYSVRFNVNQYGDIDLWNAKFSKLNRN